LGKLALAGDYLGMSITKMAKDASARGNNNLSRKQQQQQQQQRDTREVFECKVESLKDGVLDMYSYHRGREGMEPRDPATGELYCCQEATDTNHDWDAPKLGTTIVIEFPLEDETDSKGNDSEQKESLDKATYRESLNWDLSDPSTPSPLTFANDIANDYGLSFGQMMDLALSIQQQIDSYLKSNHSYSAPLALKDPLGNERQFVGPSIQAHRYDQVLQTAEGGIRLSRKEGSPRQQKTSLAASRAASTGAGSAKRKSIERLAEIIVEEHEEEIEPKYQEEIKKKAQTASVKDISQKCKNGIIGVLGRKDDFHCHVCHKRCKVTYNFACGVLSHSYCEVHCKVRKTYS
jgi:ribosomal protein S17E